MLLYTILDCRYIESLQTLLGLSAEVLDHLLPGGEEQTVVVGGDAGNSVPRHVADLIDVDVSIPLAGYHGVGPPAVFLGGAHFPLTEDTNVSTPTTGCWSLPPVLIVNLTSWN